MARPNGTVPGAWEMRDRELETLRFSENDSDDNDEKFPDLSKFMNLPEGLKLRSKTLSCLKPKPGSIIYLKDTTEKAIANRVMVVLYVAAGSAVCLSFCLHWPRESDDHWFVYKSGQVGAADRNDDTNRLNIVLEPTAATETLPPEGLAPKSGVTIDIRQIWNLETTTDKVKVVWLGKVEEKSLQRLSRAVKNTFGGYLDRAIKQPEPRPEPKPPSKVQTFGGDSHPDQVSLHCTLYVVIGGVQHQCRVQANSSQYRRNTTIDPEDATQEYSLHSTVYYTTGGIKRKWQLEGRTTLRSPARNGNRFPDSSDYICLRGTIDAIIGGPQQRRHIQATSTRFEVCEGTNVQANEDRCSWVTTITVPTLTHNKQFQMKDNNSQLS